MTERGGGHRDERYRSSRHDERGGGGDREHRSDRDRYGGDRDRGGGGGGMRRGGDDRRGDRDKYSRGGRDGDDGRHSSRYDGDRRRDHRAPRNDDYVVPRAGGGTPHDDGPARGGDRRGRGKGRDGMGTPERRSPTPEGAVPLSQRKRKASGWDVHAPGYEQYTALQAKQTGMALLILRALLLTELFKGCLTFLGLIVHRYLPSSVLRVYLLPCLSRPLAWALAVILTSHVNLVDFTLAVSRRK